MKKIKIALCILLSLTVLVCLYGCRNKDETQTTAAPEDTNTADVGETAEYGGKTEETSEEETVLPAQDIVVVSYSEQVTGTEESAGGLLFTLTKKADGTFLLLRTDTLGGDNRDSVTVPASVYSVVLNIALSYSMNTWNAKPGNIALDGKLYECTFVTENGTPYTVSSGDMPEQGVLAFNSIRSVLELAMPAPDGTEEITYEDAAG